MSRTVVAMAMLTATVVGALCGPVRAQPAFPSKTVTFVVPFAAGSSPDVMTRIIAEAVSKDLPQAVVVENKAGAGGNVAAQSVARSAPDGHTIFVGTTGNLAVARSLYKVLAYNPETDFIAVSTAWTTWNVLVVRTGSRFKSVGDVLAEAKAKPGTLTFGTPGAGTAGHLAGKWFEQLTGTQLLHVPYRGQNQVVQDVLSGALDLSFETIGTALPVIQGGQLVPLAATGLQRLKALPDVPTFQEAGIGPLDISGWAMMVLPAGTSAEIVTRWSGLLVKAMETPSVKERIEALGVVLKPSTPQAARDFLKGELKKYEGIVKAAGLQLE